MCYIAVVFVDFTVKNFSGLLHFMSLVEIKGAKLELIFNQPGIYRVLIYSLTCEKVSNCFEDVSFD